MESKLKLADIHQAAEALKAGCEVEFYLVVTERPFKRKKSRSGRNPAANNMRDSTALRLGARRPEKGSAAPLIYARVANRLGNDLTKTITRGEIVEMCSDAIERGSSVRAVANMVRCKTLHIVDWMAKRTKNLKDLEESGWVISPRMRAYCAEKYPDIDVDGTYELFCDKALANDWVYANWDAAFREYLRKPREWGGFAYQTGMDNPNGRQLIIEAKALGFRKPGLPQETPDQYRQALRAFVPKQQGFQIDTSSILKRIPGGEKAG